MTEKEKLLSNLIEKSGKSKDELMVLIHDKVNELSGLVSEEGAIYIIANELGVRLEVEKPKKEVEFKKIKEITEPKVPISLIVKVLKKYDKVNFKTSAGSEGSVQSILAGDDTGITRITFWNDQTEILDNIVEGDFLKIINAYTRENTQNPERIDVHYGQYSDIEVNPEGVNFEVVDFKPNIDVVEKKISDLEPGDKNVKLEVTITDFDIPRFYVACPDCFKKVFQDEGISKCAEHGEVDSIKVPIVNLIVDDGSGTIPIVGFRDRAEKITNLNSDEIIALTEDIDKYRNFSNRIIGSRLVFIGNVTLNSMTGEVQVMVNNVDLLELKEGVDGEAILGDSENIKSGDLSSDMGESKKNSVDELVEEIEIEEVDLDDDLM